MNCGGGGGDIVLLFGLNELRILGERVDGANGEVAILSEVDKLENILRASGKFGGVAGVLAGVISCKKSIERYHSCL